MSTSSALRWSQKILDCHVPPPTLGVVHRRRARGRSRAPMRDAVYTADPGSVFVDVRIRETLHHAGRDRVNEAQIFPRSAGQILVDG
jgi:hypothetical protein